MNFDLNRCKNTDNGRPSLIGCYRSWRIFESAEMEGRRSSSFVNFGAIQRLLRHYIEETFGYAPDIINGDTPPRPNTRQVVRNGLRLFKPGPDSVL